MPNLNSTATTFILAACFAVAVMSTLDWTSTPKVSDKGVVSMEAFTAHAEADAQNSTAKRAWAASATGRIEPNSGAINISAETAGRIVSVPVETGSQVKAGDVLVQLDDVDALSRIAAAAAEVDVRKLERAEEPVTGIAEERYEAQDALSDARRSLFAAKMSFDAALADQRSGSDIADDVAKARRTVDDATATVDKTRKVLASVLAKEDAPLPSRLETSLEIARSDLDLAEQAFERTRIRAPFDGTVLRTMASVGEVATPSPANVLVMFGDVSSLRVRAEVEERDVGHVRVGQKVVVRSDAFPEREFEGTVTSVSSALGRPQIATRGPRRPNDVDVLEVLAEIDGKPPLLTGMRVDVFFKVNDKKTSETSTSAADQ
ncbi:MAG: HlyD family secretion protein [Hyphomicrobiaceae bacterium]